MVFRSLSVIGALVIALTQPLPVAAGPALDRVLDQGIIVGAADPAWPPFSWRDPMGEFHGFDVEVTREIADRLGVRAEFVTPSWEEQTSGVWDGRWDIAVVSMTPTVERAQRLVFPAIYSYGFAALAVDAGDDAIHDLTAASGKRIAVVEETTFDAYLRHKDMGIEGLADVAHQVDASEIVAYAESAAIYRAVYQDDTADALVDDLRAIKAQIAQGRPLRIVGEPLFAAPEAVAVEMGDPAFAEEIARIVGDLRADGTLRALSMKWFDRDVTTPP